MIPSDFIDVMPHRLKVRKTVKRDDYGYPVEDQPDLIYVCLLDDAVTITDTQASTDREIKHMAYVLPYPLNADGTFQTNAVTISEADVVITPDGKEHQIKEIATHWDETGAAHNQEVTYS